MILELKQILHILVSKKNWWKGNLKYCKNIGNGKITNIDLGIGKYWNMDVICLLKAAQHVWWVLYASMPDDLEKSRCEFTNKRGLNC